MTAAWFHDRCKVYGSVMFSKGKDGRWLGVSSLRRRAIFRGHMLIQGLKF